MPSWADVLPVAEQEEQMIISKQVVLSLFEEARALQPSSQQLCLLSQENSQQCLQREYIGRSAVAHK